MSISNRKKGFTLVELLVVIAIIAILAGLLLPALENARNTAISLQCLTRMRNWGSALNYYGNDFDQIYPCALWLYKVTDYRRPPSPADTPVEYQGWWKRTLVGAYIDAVAEQRGETLPNLSELGVGCPAVPMITEIYPGYGLWARSMELGDWGSCLHQYYMSSDFGCTVLSKVKSPSGKAVLAETGDPYFISYHGVYQNGGYRFYDRIDYFLNQDSNFPNMPHNQGANYLFFDGHASWYPGFPAYQSIPSQMLRICDAYEERIGYEYGSYADK